MKKLISELESAVENYNLNFGGTQYDDGMVSGFETAIEIVKSHDSWIDVSELPPAMDKDGFQIAYLLSYKGFHWVAYHNEVSWYDESNQEYITRVNDTDAKWTYLPEVTK